MKYTLVPIVALILGGGLVACEQDDPSERAMDKMEEAGDNIGDAAHDAGNAIEDTCEDMKEKAGADDTDC